MRTRCHKLSGLVVLSFLMAVSGLWGATTSIDLNFTVNRSWQSTDDGDAVGNEWEIYWFGNLAVVSADSDYDEDGFSDFAEYVAGTNPLDPSSLLGVTSMRLLGDGTVELEWMTETVASASGWSTGAGRVRTYNIYGADTVDELESEGELLFSGIVPAGAYTTVAAPVGSGGFMRFYKVEVNAD